MTVYELIQELAQCDANTEVRFKAEISFDTDVNVNLDGEEEQEVSVEFDDELSFDDISIKRDWNRKEYIQIELSY